MGKRELLLVVGFVVIGVVVYHATAPPRDPNDKGVSFSRFFESVRREIRGNRASVELARSETVAVDPQITEVRIVGWMAELTVIGEDRPDIETAVRIRSAAPEEAEARRFAEQTVLVQDRAGSSLTFRVKYLRGRDIGRQWSYLTMKVPSRLRVRVEGVGKIAISDVAGGVELGGSRGEVRLTNIGGTAVISSHSGGEFTIEDVQSLKFNGRGVDLRVKGVHADSSIALEGGGELAASRLAGPIEVESRNAEVALENLEDTRGAIRVNAFDGSVTLRGVKTETRIDGRHAEIDVTMAGAAPVAIYNEGESVAVTLPEGGYKLDAVAIDGRITPPSVLSALGFEYSTTADAREARVSGVVKGGGPTLTIRITRGDLTVRPPSEAGGK